MAGVVLASSLNLVSVVVAALAEATLMVMTRCLDPQDAYSAIEWKVLVLLAGVLTLGKAVEVTGTAALLAGGLIGWF